MTPRPFPRDGRVVEGEIRAEHGVGLPHFVGMRFGEGEAALATARQHPEKFDPELVTDLEEQVALFRF